MNCLTCPQGYYLIENTNTCQEYPYPGYYLEDDKLKKCYKNCLTCSTGPVTNSKGEVSNMNCDSCDESKGFLDQSESWSLLSNSLPNNSKVISDNLGTFFFFFIVW